MLNLRYIFRLIVAYVKRFKGIIAISVIFGIVMFIAFRFVIPLLSQRSTETIGITGRYHTDEIPLFILEKISDGLTKIKDDGTVEPALAKSWETPDKGKTWIFTLNDNLTWQDKSKLTSDTVIYEFSDVEIERPDEKTIIFKLEEIFTPFPAVVSRPTFRRGLLGTGDWEVEKATVANNYVQELIIQKGKEKIVYKFYPTEERTKLAFKLGHVDKLINIYSSSPFDKWHTTEIENEINEEQIVTLFFNTNDALLSEKDLRQALAYSIDKSEFSGVRAISPISPNSWAYNPVVKSYDHNPERARELIEDIPDSLKEQYPIKLVTTPALLTTAEKIAEYWTSMGVDTVIQVSSIIPAEFQVFLTIYDIPKDPDQYPVWHSTQESTNISNYSNDRIDKLLEEGRTELDIEERKKIYLDFQRFLLEDLPASFLYHPQYHTIQRG